MRKGVFAANLKTGAPAQSRATPAGEKEMLRWASHGVTRVRHVLHDTGKPVAGGSGIRPGTVVGVQGDSQLKVKYDQLKLDGRTLAAKDVVIDKTDKLSKAPPETRENARPYSRSYFSPKSLEDTY